MRSEVIYVDLMKVFICNQYCDFCQVISIMGLGRLPNFVTLNVKYGSKGH